MKKQISLILAIIMLLCLFAGCGNSNEDVGGTISGPSASPESSQDETELETEAEAEGKEIDLGSISGGAVYTNDFAGITFTLPEDWAFASQEELAEMMNLSAEMVIEDKKALVEYAMESTVYDMMAFSPDATQNVLVMFENVARNLIGGLLSVDAYLDILESQVNDYAQGFTYKIESRSDITLGGVDYRCLSTSIEEYGIYQDYVVRREGKYMICLAVTGTEINPAATMGEYFT